PLRPAERSCSPAGRQSRQPRGARRGPRRLREGHQASRKGAPEQRRRQALGAAADVRAVERLAMGLHDRLNRPAPNADPHAPERPVTVPIADRRPHLASVDPYAEMKTRIHHACIATLGPELFASESAGDLSERVIRAVMEQLALDRTPLTREERRQIVKEITDDILGYGPLEPFLQDDSVTEVMVNGWDKIFIERAG